MICLASIWIYRRSTDRTFYQHILGMYVCITGSYVLKVWGFFYCLCLFLVSIENPADEGPTSMSLPSEATVDVQKIKTLKLLTYRLV